MNLILYFFLLRLLQFRLLSFQMNPFAYDNKQGTGRLTSVGAVRSVIFEMFALITVNLEEGWGKWERDKQLRFLFFGRRGALLFSYWIIVWGEGMGSPSGGIAKPGKLSADWFGIRQYGWIILTFNHFTYFNTWNAKHLKAGSKCVSTYHSGLYSLRPIYTQCYVRCYILYLHVSSVGTSSRGQCWAPNSQHQQLIVAIGENVDFNWLSFLICHPLLFETPAIFTLSVESS